MKKYFLSTLFILFLFSSADAETKVKTIYEGNTDAKIKLIIYESLTCSHCANFHTDVYPKLKKNFIDKGLVGIEYRNFPLDMAAFNASKIAHCKNDGKAEILHFLFKNQKNWVTGSSIDQTNSNLKKILDDQDFTLDFDNCISNKLVENYVLEDRIEGVKKFKINSTPTLIINNKKFDKPLTYKNLEKTLEKMI